MGTHLLRSALPDQGVVMHHHGFAMSDVPERSPSEIPEGRPQEVPAPSPDQAVERPAPEIPARRPGNSER
jgi:hypothetical protein